MNKIVRQSLQYIFNSLSNPGGINFKLSRFAGNLYSTSISIDQHLAICHSLIFANGVRKTTNTNRNISAINKLLNDIDDSQFDKEMKILDIGSSTGLSSRDNYKVISEKYDIKSYCLGDLYTKIYFDKKTETIFDQDYQILQVRNKIFFYNMNFDYLNKLQRLINLPNYILRLIIGKNKKFKKENLQEIKLIIPDLVYTNSPFYLKRMDVFKKIDESFDLIICFHLLVDRYFEKENIDLATKNLVDSLNPGGVLLVGASEKYKMIIKQVDHKIIEIIIEA